MSRYTFYLCMVVILPLQLQAQISTSIADKHNLWTVAKTIQCNHEPPGTTGSAQTWNYSGVTPLNVNDTDKTYYLSQPSNSLYPNASIMAKQNGKYTFYDYSGNSVFLLGMVDSSSTPPDTTMYMNTKQIMKHPITYGDRFTDSFTFAMGTDSAKGAFTDTVESFGKLILPYDTFENVIRMRVTDDAEVSVSGVATQITRISYRWYDLDHRTPLLRIDSVTESSGLGTNTYKELHYLLEEVPTGITETTKERLPLTALFVNNTLAITSGTETGHTYQMALFSISGQRIISTTFAGGNKKQFNLPDVSPGMYMLLVRDADNYHKNATLKLMKR